jgi:hypothetical protein
VVKIPALDRLPAIAPISVFPLLRLVVGSGYNQAKSTVGLLRHSFHELRMRDSVKAFFARLHQQHLKGLGYTKVRHTFSRKMDRYTERIQFQGSSWNSATEPWRFYINVGVEFDGLPTSSNKGFPGTHCWARISSFASKAPEQYDLVDTAIDLFADEIAGYLQAASQELARNADKVRAYYEKTKEPWIGMRFH